MYFFLDPSWHLIFGGNGLIPTSRLQSVELFNWQTGEQCQLPDLPTGVTSHMATVLDDVPVYCGGFSDMSKKADRSCYKLDKTSKTWIKVDVSLLDNEWLSNPPIPTRQPPPINHEKAVTRLHFLKHKTQFYD